MIRSPTSAVRWPTGRRSVGRSSMRRRWNAARQPFRTRPHSPPTTSERTGRTPRHSKYWRALGLWKVAIIAQGILKRVQDNRSNRAAGGVPTPVVDSMLDMALSVADDAGI